MARTFAKRDNSKKTMDNLLKLIGLYSKSGLAKKTGLSRYQILMYSKKGIPLNMLKKFENID